MYMRQYLDVTEIRPNRASSSVSLTKSQRNPCWRKHKGLGSRRALPWISLLWAFMMFDSLSMSWWDCASTGDPDSIHGCVHGDHCCVEQSKNERIPRFHYPKVFRCVSTDVGYACMRAVHELSGCLIRIAFYREQCAEWNADVIGEVTAYKSFFDKYFVLCVDIVVPVQETRRARLWSPAYSCAMCDFCLHMIRKEIIP